MTILVEIYGNLFFLDPVVVLSIGRNPIQVLLIRSNPVRVCQSDPIRSGPGFVNALSKALFQLFGLLFLARVASQHIISLVLSMQDIILGIVTSPCPLLNF